MHPTVPKRSDNTITVYGRTRPGISRFSILSIRPFHTWQLSGSGCLNRPDTALPGPDNRPDTRVPSHGLPQRSCSTFTKHCTHTYPPITAPYAAARIPAAGVSVGRAPCERCPTTASGHVHGLQMTLRGPVLPVTTRRGTTGSAEVTRIIREGELRRRHGYLCTDVKKIHGVCKLS